MGRFIELALMLVFVSAVETLAALAAMLPVLVAMLAVLVDMLLVLVPMLVDKVPAKSASLFNDVAISPQRV